MSNRVRSRQVTHVYEDRPVMKTMEQTESRQTTATGPAVFISYSSFDRTAAFTVMRLLQDHGCDVWLDFFDIKPAEVLDSELSSGIAQADVVCLLLSPTSVASAWVAREVALARAQ